MLQYFKFNENAVGEKRYQVMAGKKAYFFLGKSALVSIFMIYATFFVAAAIPFLTPNHPAVFIVGGVISLAILVRTVVFFTRFFMDTPFFCGVVGWWWQTSLPFFSCIASPLSSGCA